MMARHSRRCFAHWSFFLLLFFQIRGQGVAAPKTQQTSLAGGALRLYLPESGWVLADLDGDHRPDFVAGERLNRTKDGYSYKVELQLSSVTPPTSFTVLHNNALGLTITGVDVDGDDDIDLIISDRFFRQHIGIWLNDGKGRFVKSSPDRFSLTSGADLAFVAVNRNWASQSTLYKQRRLLPDYLTTTGRIQPLLLKGSTLNHSPAEWLFHFATDSHYGRAPPTT